MKIQNFMINTVVNESAIVIFVVEKGKERKEGEKKKVFPFEKEKLREKKGKRFE